ncbi:unnamed protein product, partial [Symbiodinium sp. CCMP2456]
SRMCGRCLRSSVRSGWATERPSFGGRSATARPAGSALHAWHERSCALQRGPRHSGCSAVSV